MAEYIDVDELNKSGEPWAVSMAGYKNNLKPALAYKSSSARSNNIQRNQIDSDGIAGELENIKKGISPFTSDDSGAVSVTDAIVLCQKAYWNIAIFRSTIDIQTEFANSKIKFKSPNKTVEKFYTAWYDMIGSSNLSDQIMREWFRSGNVFLYSFPAKLTQSQVKQLIRNKRSTAAVEDKEIPLKYILLNPKDIRCMGNSSFIDAKYGKVFSKYELDRYKSKYKTPEEEAFLESLPAEVKEQIKRGGVPILELESSRLSALFCAKQDYEPMACPMYYPVLADINLKLEFKKAEQVIARTVDYAVLLITCGDPNKDPVYNGKIRESIASMFSSESIGRVLIADYTTKLEFAIPDLNKIFGSEKYKSVNEDIANGLMNIFWSEEKFAASMIKIQIFLERLNQAREAYVSRFLKPQMKLIANTLGFQDIPEVEFEQINLRDDLELQKLYVHLLEIGALTPEETIEAMKTGLLPLHEDSVESQKKFKDLRDKELFMPVLNKKTEEGKAGRPTGTKAPQSKKKISPVGASFSLSKIRSTIDKVSSLASKFEEEYKNQTNLRRLSKKHKEICWKNIEAIAVNERIENWESKIKDYLSEFKVSGEVTDETISLAVQHQVDGLTGAILFNSTITPEESECINDTEE